MIQALEARDSAALASVLTAHLNNKRDVVIEQLRSMEVQTMQPHGAAE